MAPCTARWLSRRSGVSRDWGWARLTALLLACFLAACAHAPASAPRAAIELPPLRLAPAALGKSLALQQQLVFSFGTQTRELSALLEVDAQQVRLVVQAMGQSGVRLTWDGKTLDQQRAAWLPPAVRGERVLDDLQFSLWPAQAIRAALPAGWTLHEQDGRRELQHAGTAWLIVQRDANGLMQLDNRAEGYRLEIESIASDGAAP